MSNTQLVFPFPPSQSAWWRASPWWKARLLWEAVLKISRLPETGGGKFLSHPKAGHLILPTVNLKKQAQPEQIYHIHCRHLERGWLNPFQSHKWALEAQRQASPRASSGALLQHSSWHHSQMYLIKLGGGREGKLGGCSRQQSCSWFSSQSALLGIPPFCCWRCWWHAPNKLYVPVPTHSTPTSLLSGAACFSQLTRLIQMFLLEIMSGAVYCTSLQAGLLVFNIRQSGRTMLMARVKASKLSHCKAGHASTFVIAYYSRRGKCPFFTETRIWPQLSFLLQSHL